MTTTHITLDQYERAERTMEAKTARSGLAIHAVITVLVSIGLVLLNVLAVPEFPWSIFPVAGMVIGLTAHWWFGYHELEETLLRRQHDIERRAAEM